MTRRRALAALAVLAVLGGAAAYYGPAMLVSVPAPPPVPDGLTDARLAAAIRAAREAVEQAPRSADAWGKLGMTFRANSFDPPANDCFAVAARLAPNDPRWPYQLGYYKLFHDPDHALPDLERAAAGTGGRPEERAAARMRLAEAYLERQRPDDAERLCRQQLDQQPGDPRAHLGLGLIKLARDDPKGAESHLKTAARHPSAKRKALTQLALVARLAGDPATADRFAAEAAKLPEDPPWDDPMLAALRESAAGRKADHNAASRTARAGDPEGAVRILTETARTDPNVETFILLGENQVAVGRPADGVRSFREALRLDPDRVQGHYGLGMALALTADAAGPGKPAVLREALAELDTAIRLKPDYANPYLYRGQVQAALGDESAALGSLVRGLELAPNLPEMHVALLIFLDRAGRAADARARLPAAEKVVPADDPQFQAIRAKLLAGR